VPDSLRKKSVLLITAAFLFPRCLGIQPVFVPPGRRKALKREVFLLFLFISLLLRFCCSLLQFRLRPARGDATVSCVFLFSLPQSRDTAHHVPRHFERGINISPIPFFLDARALDASFFDGMGLPPARRFPPFFPTTFAGRTCCIEISLALTFPPPGFERRFPNQKRVPLYFTAVMFFPPSFFSRVRSL